MYEEYLKRDWRGAGKIGFWFTEKPDPSVFVAAAFRGRNWNCEQRGVAIWSTMDKI